MPVFPIPNGIRGGFPKPLNVSSDSAAFTDYETQSTLARAVQVLACRRRLTIPGGCYRVMDSTKITTMLLPFVAQRENFSRTARLSLFYKTNLLDGQINLECRITNPSLTLKEMRLPFTGGVSREVVVDFELGVGDSSSYGQIEGYLQLALDGWRPASEIALVTVLGWNLDPEEAGRIEI